MLKVVKTGRSCHDGFPFKLRVRGLLAKGFAVRRESVAFRSCATDRRRVRGGVLWRARRVLGALSVLAVQRPQRGFGLSCARDSSGARLPAPSHAQPLNAISRAITPGNLSEQCLRDTFPGHLLAQTHIQSLQDDMSLCNFSGGLLVTFLCAISRTTSWRHLSAQSLGCCLSGAISGAISW